MNKPAEQLALNVRLRESATFGSYHAVGNQAALASIQALVAGDSEEQIYLWGGTGTGKSHLLQAACNAQATQFQPGAYIPLDHFPASGAQLLEGMEQLPLICLDNVDVIAGQPEWERGLFNLINATRQAGHHLLMASRQNPSALDIHLPDLASRLLWGPVFHLRSLDDAGKLSALQMDASQRGFELSEDVARFLMHHCARDMRSLQALLERLDLASLQAQRRITIPFIKSVLNL